jgi:DNA adenine methylase
MTIKALAPWYGSKRTLAPRIVRELGPHKFYVEPFCGSCAVLLAKPVAGVETVNDLHGDLVNLARVLASPLAESLFARCARMLMAEAVHAEAREVCGEPGEVAASVAAVTMAHVERAAWYMVLSWQGRNGSAGTSMTNLTTARRFTHNGGSGGLRWASAVASIPAWHDRLSRVCITSMDAFDLLGRLADQDGTAVYVDPPYLRKSDKYVHDLATPDQHARLAGVLGRFRRARVVVSYYDEPEIREWYRGWTLVSCPITKGLVNQGRRDEGGKESAPEILIINGPSRTAGRLFDQATSAREAPPQAKTQCDRGDE